MSDTFKVWVQVERIGGTDDGAELDDFENIGLPDSLAEFDNFEGAAAFIRTLPGWNVAENSETSDYRAEGADNEPCPCDRPGPVLHMVGEACCQ